MNTSIWVIKNIFTDFSLSFINEKDAEDVAIKKNQDSHLQDEHEKEFYVVEVKVLGNTEAQKYL